MKISLRFSGRLCAGSRHLSAFHARICEHALHHTPVDYCMPLAGIAPLLVSLAAAHG